MVTIGQVRGAAEIAALTEMVRAYTAWALTLQEGSEVAPTFETLERELAALPGPYAPPDGRFLLAKLDGQPAGCVALLGHDATTCELRRLYVEPSFRGNGIGKALVTELLTEARLAGYARMVLDSHISMRGAHALYESLGFHRVSAPDDFPETLMPVVVFMERDLDPP